MISGHTRVFGLLGHPVRHSLSPEMHTALFRQLGLDAVYVAFDVLPQRAGQVADSIRTLDLVGVNLTVPFKESVLPHLDHLTLAAREAGAVNCVINVDGYLTGYNTDGAGLMAALDEEFGFQAAGQTCLVLGAGGAGRAAAASLAARGAKHVVLMNRTRARAERAVAEIVRPGLVAEGLDAASWSRWADAAGLVVNCLGGGAEARVEALDVGRLPTSAVWYDINYWMKDPPALKACQERGLRVGSGLGMLIHQGALSFELFTGCPVQPDDLRQILKERRSPKS